MPRGILETMKLSQYIMLSCSTASALIQKKESGDLRFKEKLQLRMHLPACHFCRKYEKQSNRLSEFLDAHFSADFKGENQAFKERLKAEIREKT
jgi:hypothetical protein